MKAAAALPPYALMSGCPSISQMRTVNASGVSRLPVPYIEASIRIFKLRSLSIGLCYSAGGRYVRMASGFICTISFATSAPSSFQVSWLMAWRSSPRNEGLANR